MPKPFNDSGILIVTQWKFGKHVHTQCYINSQTFVSQQTGQSNILITLQETRFYFILEVITEF